MNHRLRSCKPAGHLPIGTAQNSAGVMAPGAEMRDNSFSE